MKHPLYSESPGACYYKNVSRSEQADWHSFRFVTHVAEVQDEAVALVKAVPADWDLCSPYDTPTFDLEHTLNHYLVGDDMLEPWSDSSFLIWRENV